MEELLDLKNSMNNVDLNKVECFFHRLTPIAGYVHMEIYAQPSKIETFGGFHLESDMELGIEAVIWSGYCSSGGQPRIDQPSVC